MKKGQQFEAAIEKVDFPNKGKLHLEDREVTIKGTIQGQKVKFQIQKLRKGRATGRLLEVTEPSPMEDAAPLCPHFGACGGCFYQTVSYKNQLKIKESQIQELLDSVCSGYRWDGIKGSPDQWEYRNKMEFSFGDEFKGGPLALGMHKKGGFYDIVTVSDCKIVHEDYTKILNCVLEYCANQEFSFYHKMSHEGFLRHLVIRRSVSTGEILVNLVTSSQEVHDFTPLVDKILELPLHGELAGFLHTVNDSLSDVVKSDETHILYGRDYFYEHILGLKFKISPFSFFQTNSKGAEVLYETARGYIGDTKDKVIFDLYSGTGTIAQMLAPVAKKVVGVEIVEEAVEAAKENAALNGLDNCEFIAGDVLKVVDDLQDKPDFIVLDPPRDGIHPKAIGKIIDFGVKEMVYISCKPTSLVRDLEVLQAAGYRVKEACAVDMFPNTVHTESIVHLSRK